jgi:ankyrin repeat protein
MLRKIFVTTILVVALVVPAFAANMKLVDAAKTGDIDAVRALLKEKANVNEAQGDGMTPLHWAVYSNNFEVAELLVRSGADVKAVTRLDSSTPLRKPQCQGQIEGTNAVDVRGRHEPRCGDPRSGSQRGENQ